MYLEQRPSQSQSSGKLLAIPRQRLPGVDALDPFLRFILHTPAAYAAGVAPFLFNVCACTVPRGGIHCSAWAWAKSKARIHTSMLFYTALFVLLPTAAGARLVTANLGVRRCFRDATNAQQFSFRFE